jgi:hypothetical protein
MMDVENRLVWVKECIVVTIWKRPGAENSLAYYMSRIL